MLSQKLSQNVNLKCTIYYQLNLLYANYHHNSELKVLWTVTYYLNIVLNFNLLTRVYLVAKNNSFRATTKSACGAGPESAHVPATAHYVIVAKTLIHRQTGGTPGIFIFLGLIYGTPIINRLKTSQIRKDLLQITDTCVWIQEFSKITDH